MKKRIVSLFVISTVISSVNAATQAIVWGESTKALPQFMQAHPFKKQGLLQTVKSQQSDYKLELQNNSNHATRHARYQITYKGVPVWGYQVIFHSKDGAKETVTGMNITGIEQDINSTEGKLSPNDIEQKILGKVTEPAMAST
ncbi:hypothetical protein [Legionella pneumophila]|uniref:hypothetical protein n=1 Tax=Legionella pneumophila TaxID=446 RepID=UPI0005C43342|nr:hypothetical protein [Legionella pneumophila]GAN31390.1 fungalysin/Thermolysin Propeptide Motif protein [Legionella pneumophila]